MEEEIKTHISNYEILKRNKDVIKSIDKDYFFELVDCLIIGYREIEEERRMFYRGNVYTANQLKNSIPKSKIKEKIEELDKQRIKMEKEDNGVGFTLGNDWSDLKAKIQVLQELMEEK